jgi:hypothetical protein
VHRVITRDFVQSHRSLNYEDAHLNRDIEARRDDTALVQSANQFHNNLSGAVVIDDFELANVTCTHRMQSLDLARLSSNRLFKLTILLHNLEELDHHLGGRSEQNLSLSSLLSVGKGLQAIGQHGHFRHLQHDTNRQTAVSPSPKPTERQTP